MRKMKVIGEYFVRTIGEVLKVLNENVLNGF